MNAEDKSDRLGTSDDGGRQRAAGGAGNEARGGEWRNGGEGEEHVRYYVPPDLVTMKEEWAAKAGRGDAAEAEGGKEDAPPPSGEGGVGGTNEEIPPAWGGDHSSESRNEHRRMAAQVRPNAESEDEGAAPPLIGGDSDALPPASTQQNEPPRYPAATTVSPPVADDGMVPLLLTAAALAIGLYCLFGRRSSSFGGSSVGQALMTEEERRERRERAANLALGRVGGDDTNYASVDDSRGAAAASSTPSPVSEPKSSIPVGTTGGKTRSDAKQTRSLDPEERRRDATLSAALGRETREAKLDDGNIGADKTDSDGCSGPSTAAALETGATKDRSSPAAKPPSKAPPPPAQILCLALRAVLLCDVKVVAAPVGPSSDDSTASADHRPRKSWVGIGWKSRPAPRVGARPRERVRVGAKKWNDSEVVELDLLRFAPPLPSHHEGKIISREDDWSDLRTALSSLLSSPSHNPLLCHICPPFPDGRVRTVLRDMESLGDCDRARLGDCLAEVERFGINSFAEGLKKGIMSRRERYDLLGRLRRRAAEGSNGTIVEVEAEETLELGLFEDSYGTVTPVQRDGVDGDEEDSCWPDLGSGCMMSCLLQLLGRGPPDITEHFLADIIKTYHNTAADSSSAKDGDGDISLPDALLSVLFLFDVSSIEARDARRRLSAISNALSLSPDIAKALSRRLEWEAKEFGSAAPIAAAAAATHEPSPDSKAAASTTGRTLEESSVLRDLLLLSAVAVPEAGAESTDPSTVKSDSFLLRRLHSINTFPLCFFDRRREQVYPGGDREKVGKATDEAQDVILQARETAALALKRAAAAGERGSVTGWVAAMVRSNEPLVHILEADLLSATGVAQRSCSSRPFLLGAAASLLTMSSRSLTERFEKVAGSPRGNGGAGGSFDARYLRGDVMGVAPDERRLVPAPVGGGDAESLATPSSSDGGGAFAGATEFFFLTCAVLRVSLFHSLRVRDEFNKRHRSVFDDLQRNAAKLPVGRPTPGARVRIRMSEQHRRTADVHLMWSMSLDNPALVELAAEFSLLQVRWLAEIAGGGENHDPASLLAAVPEWMCKLPSQWIAHVAMNHPRLVRPADGEAAVRCATRLLNAGGGSGADGLRLSPAVTTQLIRIAGAFVRSGVGRARARYLAKRRKPRPQSGDEEENDVFDERDLDIYSSFDKDDLGVTVFANRFVATTLFPTLMDAFVLMDAVEGVDVEKEHHFHKNQVKSEIAELMLRLWSHPSGECRASLVRLDGDVVSGFTSSVVAAFGMSFDNALDQVANMKNILGGGWATPGFQLSARDKRYCEFVGPNVSGGLAAARRLLLLLTRLSEDEKVASVLGGSAAVGGVPVCLSAAAMFVHFVDLLTAEDGGTNADIDFRASELSTSALAERVSCMSSVEREREITDLWNARTFIAQQFGLDVSVLCHWLLALAARWHLAASKDSKPCSSFLRAVATHEDCNIVQLRRIYTRLIAFDEKGRSCAMDPWTSDGHGDSMPVKNKVNLPRVIEIGRTQRYSSTQDQMNHSSLNLISSQVKILAFLDDLEEMMKKNATPVGHSRKLLDTIDLKSLERSVFASESAQDELNDDGYTENLVDFVVSSESFLSPANTNSYAHSFASVAQRSQNASIGKLLIKEARKCQKNIPAPHPDSSIFVCFDENRVDLCRAIVIGAADTPYAGGVYEFDLFFPSSYPSVPPLVHYKTTGGGTVRFSANLYTDGKVCISLLGTTNAWNEGQRWNPASSSLVQVLMSIQTQILGVPDPFFSEGFGHEAQKNTRAGQEGAQRYHNSLRLAVLRHAVIRQIRCPPVGFEEVVRRHFAMCRRRMLVQAKRWTMEAKESALGRRFERAYEELASLLCSHSLISESPKDVLRALPPSQDDVNALNGFDPAFLAAYGLRPCTDEKDEDTKLPPTNTASASVGAASNPWSNQSQNVENAGPRRDSSDDASGDSDDELYE